MRLRTLLLFSLLSLFILGTVSCRSQSPLRYGDRASCLGFFGKRAQHVGRYPFPVLGRYAWMSSDWSGSANSIIVRDVAGNVHLVNADTGETKQVNKNPVGKGGGLVTVETHSLVALSTGAGDAAMAYVYAILEEGAAKPYATIEGISSPIWHPHEQRLAGVLCPETGYYCNFLATYNVSPANTVRLETFELPYTVDGLFDWSGDGSLIAVSLYDERGAVLFYLYPESGAVNKSLNDEFRSNCVLDAQWSPVKRTIVFSTQNQETEGWDIFLESVAPAESEGRSLVNLTNSPGEDEYNVSWSPDGREIVFVKGYEEAAGGLRQELFILNVSDDSFSPVQLTDTRDEFETNPLWIANDKIAYLSWRPADSSWTLKSISLARSDAKPETLLEIPQEWYILP